MRFDFEGVETSVADKMMEDLEARLPELCGKEIEGYTVTSAGAFVYEDPVDHSSTKNGLIVRFNDGSRIVYRLSGTGSSGATIRVYLERYSQTDLNNDPLLMLTEIFKIAMAISEIPERTGKHQADVVT